MISIYIESILSNSDMRYLLKTTRVLKTASSNEVALSVTMFISPRDFHIITDKPDFYYYNRVLLAISRLI